MRATNEFQAQRSDSAFTYGYNYSVAGTVRGSSIEWTQEVNSVIRFFGARRRCSTISFCGNLDDSRTIRTGTSYDAEGNVLGDFTGAKLEAATMTCACAFVYVCVRVYACMSRCKSFNLTLLRHAV